MVTIDTTGIEPQGLVVQAELSQGAESPAVMLKGRHCTFMADEPETFGGTNRGPLPLELLLGAYLASIAQLTRVAAKEADIELHKIDLEAKAEIDPRGMYGLSTVEKAIPSIGLTVSIQPVQKWIESVAEEVLERCPIYALLEQAGLELNVDWKIEEPEGIPNAS